MAVVHGSNCDSTVHLKVQSQAGDQASGRVLRVCLLIVICGVAACVLLAYRRAVSIVDLAVLAGIALACTTPMRCGVAMWFIGLWMAAYSPLLLPTYWISTFPLAWLWQHRPRQRVLQTVVESLAVGFAVAWFSTPFVRDAIPVWGGMAHGVGCLLFGCQLVFVGLCARSVRDWRPIQRSVLCAAVATAAEMVQGYYGVAWSVMSISLPAAPSPVAQWARWSTQFGVSAILFFTGFLFVPDQGEIGWRRWRSPALAACFIGLASASGTWLRSDVVVKPLSFSALLVQPHWKMEPSSSLEPSIVLDRLTRLELKSGGPVDLIVWPECSLLPSSLDDAAIKPVVEALSLQSFAWQARHTYGSAALAGVAIRQEETETKYGLPVLNRRVYNCACLVPSSASMVYQKKLALVPFKECVPQWCDESFVRDHIEPFFGLSASLWPGNELQLLPWNRRDGGMVSVAAPICYESYLPWLPQYRNSELADAIIHLTYDGDFSNYPECATREIWACQYRAIETRKWNLVCTSWAGSAIIDPRGEVLARLGSRPGALRTEKMTQ